jgi:glycosyltransferase involved in cell wall biosynthesis
MPAPLFLDLTHTSHTRARTGIQRVARSLRAALADSVVGITFDPYLGAWRRLETWEQANLDSTAPTTKRGAQWPLVAKMRGRLRRFSGARPSSSLASESHSLVMPELFSDRVGAALPKLFTAISGPRVALFHDAIALKFPELTPTKTVARFPAYLQELLVFDGIAAVSDDSRESLLDYWRWAGVRDAPPVQTIPLGVDSPGNTTHEVTSASGVPKILSVGSIEGRKNHVALLEACEQLWRRGCHFELHLIGLARPETARAAVERIATLQAAGRSLRYDGAADDDTLTAAYAACRFTVYPSLMEGFGLPVLESLVHGKPCICSGRGALGESARGGGCLVLDQVGPDDLASAIGRLIDHPTECTALASAARSRRFRTWMDYAGDLRAWMKDLPRRDASR